MTREEELLLEQVTSAHRERGPDGELLPSPAFFDLPPELRREAFERTFQLRKLEAGMSRTGASTTVEAVLARIRS